ncbi:YoaK family protein [Photobacterium leiognathi]|uniref:YoaK family protein n=1 Tax=Photobacterium leiognathi TaxID=553611 RepID=UPI0029814118|nr:YoaK family protein [Photobacterium leiognathi]
MIKKTHLHSTMPFYLLFIAGIVDAIGFIHLKNGLFISFMSGNTTHVGILLTSGNVPQAWHYIGVILLFVFGAAVGEAIALANRPFYRSTIMALVSATLIITLCVEPIYSPIVTNFLLSFAMGVQNIALRLTIEKATALTYVTGFLVNTGRSIAMLLMGKGTSSTFFRHFNSWLAIFIGAIVGTQVMDYSFRYALIVPIVLTLIASGILFWTHEVEDD